MIFTKVTTPNLSSSQLEPESRHGYSEEERRPIFSCQYQTKVLEAVSYIDTISRPTSPFGNHWSA